MIVAIFVTKGFHVTSELRKATIKSYTQFEMVSEIIRPLMENYEGKLAGGVVLTTHGQMESHELVKVIDDVRVSQQKLLDQYIAATNDQETMDDKELYVCAANTILYMDKLRALAIENDVKGMHQTIYNGEFHSNFYPLHNVINKIKQAKLNEANNYRTSVEETLKNFARVMMFAGTLIVILGVLAVKYKEEAPPRTRTVHKKKISKTRAAI